VSRLAGYEHHIQPLGDEQRGGGVAAIKAGELSDVEIKQGNNAGNATWALAPEHHSIARATASEGVP
jgi:hypothetical protein